uniref:alcohol dehydrogenase (NADP(+)) n=1 Tax=Eptatretus burgeri TaxID=7764 RepID=A0A8C4QZA1_EPTBU
MKTVLLNSNYEMPVLGLGTWQSGAGQVKTAILHAFSIGYRHIDCASIYGNEAEIGEALQEALGQGKGLKREEIFVTSKLWNCNHHSEDVEDACRKSLTQLKLDYLDLYLIHWPYSFGHGGEDFPRTETGKMQYDVVDYRETWRAMENLVSAGLVRSIGLSNFNARQIDEIIASSTIRPAVLQVECHPYLGQTRLLAHCQEHHIVMTAYSPLGSPNRGWKMDNEPVLLLEPKVVSIAHRHSRSVAQVLLRWLLQRDITTIPKSITPSRIEENAKVFDFELSKDEMAELNSLDRGCRYIEPLIEGKCWGGGTYRSGEWQLLCLPQGTAATTKTLKPNPNPATEGS